MRDYVSTDFLQFLILLQELDEIWAEDLVRKLHENPKQQEVKNYYEGLNVSFQHLNKRRILNLIKFIILK